MVETLTRAKIAEAINRDIGLSREDSAAIIEDLLNEITFALLKDGSVKISSFGTFKVCRKKSRVGRNPKTAKEVMIKERNVVSFYPSNIVKSSINNKVL